MSITHYAMIVGILPQLTGEELMRVRAWIDHILKSRELDGILPNEARQPEQPYVG